MNFIPLKMIAKPGETLTPEYLVNRINIKTALLLYMIFLFLDIFLVHHIANRMPGGNPMLWSYDGALYEFQFLREILGDPAVGKFWQSTFFWFSIVWKAGIDFILIAGPSFYALKICQASNQYLRVWIVGYLYLLVGCDIFLVLGMTPWFAYELEMIAIDAQRAAVVTHLLEIWVAGLNLILFGLLYKNVFKLSFQQAYMGWFVLNIVAGILIGSVMLVVVA
jgi:hypothetical protein